MVVAPQALINAVVDPSKSEPSELALQRASGTGRPQSGGGGGGGRGTEVVGHARGLEF